MNDVNNAKTVFSNFNITNLLLQLSENIFQLLVQQLAKKSIIFLVLERILEVLYKNLRKML